MPEYELSYKNLHIVDSFKIHKDNFVYVLDIIKMRAKQDRLETKVFERDTDSLKKEWAFHNFLYNLHIARRRTKDVDLDNPCDKPEWIYKILGSLAWIFIK